jgi:hypothetical protein
MLRRSLRILVSAELLIDTSIEEYVAGERYVGLCKEQIDMRNRSRNCSGTDTLAPATQ